MIEGEGESPTGENHSADSRACVADGIVRASREKNGEEVKFCSLAAYATPLAVAAHFLRQTVLSRVNNNTASYVRYQLR